MRLNSKLLLCLAMAAFALFGSAAAAFAETAASSPASMPQDKVLSGKVLDKAGVSIPGATVVCKSNSGIWATADIDGKFELTGAPSATYVISCFGYKTVELTGTQIDGKNVVLEEDAMNLDEVVVTGYTSQKKADLTGAVTVVDVQKMKSGTYGNSMKAIQGHVAGMSVSTTGSPNPSATVRIRGEGTLNDNNPLYIIDGMPTTRSMGELASLDIESIQVLKDASSASIYGARAANGVIIITTKKGKQGVKIDFNAALTVTSKKSPYKLMNTYERGVAQYWAIKNNNSAADPTAEGIGGLYQYTDHQDANGNWVLDNVTWKEWLDDEHTMRSSDTDWQKEIMRTGVTQQYSLSLSSGKENSHSLFALDYYDSKGTIQGSFFKRYNARVNSDYTFLKGHVTVGENLTVSYIEKNESIGSGNFDNCKNLMSIVPVYTEDGNWGGPIGGMSDRQNPVRMIEDYKQNNSQTVRLLGNAYANVKIIDGLTFRTNVGLDGVGYWYRNRYYTYTSGFLSETENKVTQTANWDATLTNSNTLQYAKAFGRHNIDIMAGEELIHHKYQYVWGSRTDFALENDDYMWLDAGENNKLNGGGATENALLSFFGKVNYNYDNRYLFSATVRRDGSSVFGANNKWATFPAFSAGWTISNEKWFKGLTDVIPFLKLRYGWGANGNSSIDAYASYQFYSTLYDSNNIWDTNWGTAYDITGAGGTLPSGYRRTQRANEDLKWETTKQHNIGLDFGLFNSKLTGSFDYYMKSTDDILYYPGTVATLGEGASSWVNGACIDNKGFELQLNYADHLGDWNWFATGIFSHNKQTVTSLPESVLNNYAGNGSTDNVLGRSLNSLYGYVADGLFQSEEEVNNHATQTGAAPGRIRYKDLNNDGVIDSKDRTWIGCTDPKLEVGLNLGGGWKGFDLSMFFLGYFGRDVNVSGWKSWTDIYALSTTGENYGTRMLNAWTPTNTDTDIPALSINNYNDEGRFSTYYVENGSFFKLKNIELGYTLPKKVVDKSVIKNARIALRAENVFVLYKKKGSNAFTGIDPETPGSTYPMPFSMTMSLNITF